MDFKGNCSAIVIGSLPYSKPEKAVDLFVENLKEIMVWPQVSRRKEEGMNVQFYPHFPGWIDKEEGGKTIDPEKFIVECEKFIGMSPEEFDEKYAPTPNDMSGFYELLSRTPKVRAVKGQITGPVSQGFHFQFHKDDKIYPLMYDDFMFEVLVEYTILVAKWQVMKLRSISDNVIMFFDEPDMQSLGSSIIYISEREVKAAYEKISKEMEKIGVMRGIHCCGQKNIWDFVMSLPGIQIVNFDTYDENTRIGFLGCNYQKFIKNGGIVAWGIVPNDDDTIPKENTESVINLFETEVLGKIKGIDKEKVLENSLICHGCGMGSIKNAELAKPAMEMIKEVSEGLKDRYQLR